MSKKTGSRNPLLIPLIAVLLIAVIAVGLLFSQNSKLSTQVADVQSTLATTEANLASTEEKLTQANASLEAANADIADLTAKRTELEGTLAQAQGDLTAANESIASLTSTRTALEQRLGREPRLSEVAAECGLTPEEIAAAETAVSPTESLQRETGGDGFTLENVLGDYGQEERLLDRVTLATALAGIPERERQVIALRYFHGMTQDACARVIGVSQVQISRLERRAMEHLREIML